MEAASDKPFVQQETNWARGVALAAGLGAILFFIASFISGGALSDVREGSTADFLIAYSEDPSSAGLIPSILRAISYLLMAIPVLYLFQAASQRTPRVRRQLIGLLILGPILIAAQMLLVNGALTSAGDELVDRSPAAVEAFGSDQDVDEDGEQEELAEDLLDDQSAFSIGQYMGLAGYFAFGIGLLYAGMWAMRTGLLTRFTGSFAMALGVVFAISLILPPVSQMATFGTVLLMAYLAFFFGRPPETRPPAWRTGEAIPWPKPGEPVPEPPAEGGDIEGSGREVAERPLPEQTGSNGDGGPEGNGGSAPTKRKRRKP